MDFSDDLSSRKLKDFTYFDRDVKATHKKFTNPMLNSKKINISNKLNENNSFQKRFSQKLAERDEGSDQNSLGKIFQSQKNTVQAKKFRLPQTKKQSNIDELSSIKSSLPLDKKNAYQNENANDSFDEDYSEGYLSRSSSYDNDDIKNALGDKVEKAVYEIYGKDIPKSSIKELKESLSFVLREEVGEVPKLSEEEYDSYTAYSDGGKPEYSDQETENSYNDEDILDQNIAGFDYRAEYSDIGSEYSNLETYYSDTGSEYSETEDYEYDQIKENELQNFKLERLQQIQERQMLIMQERQYQLQVFQYGLPLDKKPIKIYQKNANRIPIFQDKPNQDLFSVPRKKGKKKQKKINQNVSIPYPKPTKGIQNAEKQSSNPPKKVKTKVNVNESKPPQAKFVSVHDFNELPLKSQHEAILQMLDSANNSKIQNIKNLIEYLMELENVSENKHYLKLSNGNDDDTSQQLINPRTIKVNLTYEATNLLYENKLLDSIPFQKIFSSLNNSIIEIKYPSEQAKSILSIINSREMRFSVFISDVTKTDTTFQKNKNLASVRLDSTIQTISDYSFQGCSSLVKATIPPSVTIIGDSAFCECKSLRYVKIPPSVVSIGEFAFCECDITEVDIPSSMKVINNATFRECSSLSRVTIPNSITRIGNYAFYYCRSLEILNLPPSVTSIGESTFEECPVSSSIPTSLIKRTNTGNTSKWKSKKKIDFMSNLVKETNKKESLTNPLGYSSGIDGNIWGMSSNAKSSDWPQKSNTGSTSEKPNLSALSNWANTESEQKSNSAWAEPEPKVSSFNFNFNKVQKEASAGTSTTAPNSASPWGEPESNSVWGASTSKGGWEDPEPESNSAWGASSNSASAWGNKPQGAWGKKKI